MRGFLDGTMDGRDIKLDSVEIGFACKRDAGNGLSARQVIILSCRYLRIGEAGPVAEHLENTMPLGLRYR
jgi:hypothetical protein